MRGRRRAGWLVALWLAALGAAPAQATVTLQVNAVTHRGYIGLFVLSSPPFHDVTVYERVEDALVQLAHPATTYAPQTKYGPVYYAPAADVAQWSCDRRVRTLVAVARADDGRTQQTEYTVRTPACTNRLALSLRRRLVTVRDTWGLGGIAADVCNPRRCVHLALAPGERRARERLGLRRGDEVTLYGPHEELTRVVGERARGGPVVLTTGDSMMQSLDTVLEDRLARRADVESDVYPGTALSSTLTVDWLALARRQVRAYRPHATIIFLGTNDSYPLTAPGGREVPCCGEEWSDLYARRARTVMRTYAQHGAGVVLWLTVPIARDARRTPAIVAVNGALARAAATVPGARVIPADEIFTPGGRYRDTMEYGGRRRRVREADGAHLSLAGARIAADAVIASLETLGVL
jgi:lysophospholipase L1-like esterase